MTKTTSCKINLLGKSYDIKCPEHEVESLHEAALKLNNHLLATKNRFKQLDSFQTLMLAALTVSHELIKATEKKEEQQFQLTQFIQSLENKIKNTSEAPSLIDEN